MPLEIGPVTSVSLWILKWLWNLAPATPNYDLRETLLSQEPTRRKPQKCPQMNSSVQLQRHSLSVILTSKPEVDQQPSSRPLPAGSRSSPATLGPGGDLHLHVRGEAQRQRHQYKATRPRENQTVQQHQRKQTQGHSGSQTPRRTTTLKRIGNITSSSIICTRTQTTKRNLEYNA